MCRKQDLDGYRVSKSKSFKSSSLSFSCVLVSQIMVYPFKSISGYRAIIFGKSTRPKMFFDNVLVPGVKDCFVVILPNSVIVCPRK